jgi:cell division protein FtsX
MKAIGQQLAADYPDLAADPDFPGFTPKLVELDDYVAGRDTRVALWILLGAALVMMSIACTNAGTLLLTRAAARRRELALRVALGATRGRLVRQMLIESAVLALVSAAVGVVSAEWLLGVLVASLAARIPRSDAVVIDSYVLVFVTGLAVVCSVFLGTVSAWRTRGLPLIEGGIDPSRGQLPILDDVISPEAFSALRVALRDGRLFNHDDTADSMPVAIVNERFARKFWGNERAVGKRFQFLDKRSGGAWVTVVGVVADMRRRRLEDEPGAQVFQPFAQAPSRGADVVIRTEVPPLSLAASVTRTIAGIDAAVPVYRMSTLPERLDDFVTNRRFHVVLLSLFAATGVLLAAIGIYGLIRQDVSQRTQEIGVRVALGASRRDVVSLVLRRCLVLTGVGIAIGWCSSLAIAGVMGSLVYGISPRDPVTFLAAPIVLLGIALIACLEPMWSAVRLDIFKALRPE